MFTEGSSQPSPRLTAQESDGKPEELFADLDALQAEVARLSRQRDDLIAALRSEIAKGIQASSPPPAASPRIDYSNLVGFELTPEIVQAWQFLSIGAAGLVRHVAKQWQASRRLRPSAEESN